jgi:hypothetical protein
MSDSEFIELLNLYIDREIEAGQAAALETEVMKNPGRRLLYHQYCQMHKACVVLAETSAEFQADERVVAFREQRRAPAGLYAATALLAAAAVAVVFTVRTARNHSLSASPALAMAPANPSALPASEQPLQPVLSARAFSVGSGAPAPWQSSDLAWISSVELPPVPPAATATSAPDSKDLRLIPTVPAGISPGEPAFEFQK